MTQRLNEKYRCFTLTQIANTNRNSDKHNTYYIATNQLCCYSEYMAENYRVNFVCVFCVLFLILCKAINRSLMCF